MKYKPGCDQCRDDATTPELTPLELVALAASLAANLERRRIQAAELAAFLEAAAPTPPGVGPGPYAAGLPESPRLPATAEQDTDESNLHNTTQPTNRSETRSNE